MSELLPAGSHGPIHPAPHDPRLAGPVFDAGQEEEGGVSWRRYVSAVMRQKWLPAVTLLVGALVSVGVWMWIQPEYTASASLWVEPETDPRRGPIQSQQLLQEYAWVDLLTSPPVVEPVVRRLRLYILPATAADSAVVAGLNISESPLTGTFRLSVDPAGERYTLARDDGAVLEEGSTDQPIGRALGWDWRPGPGQLTANRIIDFTVRDPVGVARELGGRLTPEVRGPASFIHLTLRGNDPRLVSQIVNGVAEEHVRMATELKRAKADDLTRQLAEQRDRVYQELQEKELSLEQFRIQTITEPNERAVVAPGLQMTQGPVMQDFFTKRLRLDQIDQDRRRIRAAMAATPLNIEALEFVPAVQNSRPLMGAMSELTTAKADMRTLLYRYTPEDPRVVEKQNIVTTLENQVIPTLAGQVLEGLAAEERHLQQDVDQASASLRSIPERQLQEDRLTRDATSAQALFQDINNRYETARLAAASTVPDVRVWSRASPIATPIPDQRLSLVMVILLGSLGVGLLGAILLDRIDPRVHYPEQVTSEMGLSILGAVPPILREPGKKGEENTLQVVEAFRELRLNLLYAYGSAGPGPLLLTITSPGSGDGKSLITANLGVAFAELGRKTLIIDGDTRRGDVHQLLGRSRKPGLTDYLAGNASLSEIIQKTEYESLDVISSGSRLAHAPELLGSLEMRELFADLRTQYGVILVDSSPLGAGSDAFLLGTLTGTLVMILRTGATNRELTLARLAPLARLPVRILGAILNDVQPGGVYRYYTSYLPGYGATEEGDESGRHALSAASET
ncbi:MAG: polysaccharide biosynthesis tyrosine autokinase [Gemmatimonadota bacterium]|nr:polysaccharide biosynthesis tyrosine autokinase [Gemmatimonadota bacterium]